MNTRGRGHIRKRGKHSWRLKWDISPDPETGARRQRTETVRGTKADAIRRLQTILHSIGAGDYIDPNRITVGEHLETWLEGTARHNVSPRTFERYREIIRLRWIPALGGHRLAQLAALDIKQAETRWLASGRADGKGGLSARTVRHFHWVLAGALDDAVKMRLLSRNPARDVTPPKAKPRQIVWLSPPQLRTLIDAARETRLYVPVLLAGTAGLRRGEVLALKWANVDLDAGTVSVSESLENTKDGGLRAKSPKSGQARTLALPALTVTALREHAIAQKRERLKKGKRYTDNGLVCPNTLGGYWYPRNFARAVEALVAKLDIPPVTLHGLRHTHLTHLLQAGVHPKIAQERAGHATIGVTLDTYSHAIPNMQRDAAERINALLGGAV